MDKLRYDQQTDAYAWYKKEIEKPWRVEQAKQLAKKLMFKEALPCYITISILIIIFITLFTISLYVMK